MKGYRLIYIALAALVLVLAGCRPASPAQGVDNAGEPAVTFTLITKVIDGKMVYIGNGGSIDGVINPDLAVKTGETFEIEVVNGDGMPHDIAVLELGIQTALVSKEGQSVSVTATASAAGEYAYYCTVSGHRQAGMEGRLIVSEP